MSHSFVRPAWRSLVRAPSFTITAVITLALGVGAAVAIFALVNGVLLRALPYGDTDRLVAVWHDMPGVSIHKGNQTRATYYTYRKFARSLARIGVYQSGAVNVSDPRGGSEPQRITASWLTQSVIPVLMVAPLKGRNFSQATAYRFFGDSTGRSVIGKRFREDPSAPWHTIVGVVGSTRDTAVAAAPSMAVYYSGAQNTMGLAVRTAGDASAIIPTVTRTVRELDPSLPLFDVRPMTAVFRESMAQLSFTTLVLGARFLRTLLFGVAPSDPLTLAATSLILIAIAALASWIPARRTSRLDPVEVLRVD